ncbi:hypothetical protein B9Z55_006288 [Caenorhabditis nigoni]|uniref:Uncharacterized protein n=1 Tax=Caenorhabditis nigoni TaxID=1611254 RepID=A0A2G5V4J0_9PELO|nr:hypothetical protein B9Z55_006288 [Caenorhabditis nigoni]
MAKKDKDSESIPSTEKVEKKEEKEKKEKEKVHQKWKAKVKKLRKSKSVASTQPEHLTCHCDQCKEREVIILQGSI